MGSSLYMRDMIFYLAVFAALYVAWANAGPIGISREDTWRYQCQIGCRRAGFDNGTSAGESLCGCIDYTPRENLIEKRITMPKRGRDGFR